MLSDLRNKQGLSIRELAEKSVVNYANICEIENGKYNVGIDVLAKLADALNTQIELVQILTK